MQSSHTMILNEPFYEGAWQSLNFYKEYLFGFETLVLQLRDLIYEQTACNTPKRKEN